MNPIVKFNLAINLGLIFSVTVFALNDRKDLIMTLAEKNALEKVWNQLPEEFMKSDFYLIRWVRKANLDLQQAKHLLMNTITWRERNNITKIVSEDWSDLEEDFKMSFDGIDKEGRPVLFINCGDWDIRAAVLQGRGPRLKRYLMHSTEKLMQTVTKFQKEGRRVTRVVVVTDAEGTSLQTHGCPFCVSILASWIGDSETYYPHFTEEQIIINAPAAASILFNTLKGVMTPEMREQSKMFNGNKKLWMDYLDKRIDKKYRTTRYGGSKM